jgi:hypothetical protein
MRSFKWVGRGILRGLYVLGLSVLVYTSTAEAICHGVSVHTDPHIGTTQNGAPGQTLTWPILVTYADKLADPNQAVKLNLAVSEDNPLDFLFKLSQNQVSLKPGETKEILLSVTASTEVSQEVIFPITKLLPIDNISYGFHVSAVETENPDAGFVDSTSFNFRVVFSTRLDLTLSTSKGYDLSALPMKSTVIAGVSGKLDDEYLFGNPVRMTLEDSAHHVLLQSIVKLGEKSGMATRSFLLNRKTLPSGPGNYHLHVVILDTASYVEQQLEKPLLEGEANFTVK